jgi:hypothetical protein
MALPLCIPCHQKQEWEQKVYNNIQEKQTSVVTVISVHSLFKVDDLLRDMLA